MKRLLLLLAATWACVPARTDAAISVGLGGSPLQYFAALPPVTEWSTMSIAGGAGDIVNAATMDADVNAMVSAVNVTTVLLQSPIEPPSQNAIARHNTTGLYLQTRPAGNRFLVLMATLQNNTGSDQPQLCITEDWDQKNPIPVAESVAGHRVYYSQTGTAGSWTLIPGLSVFDNDSVAASLSATITFASPWTAGSLLYVIWVDDNGLGGTTDPQEGANTIDNVQFTLCGPPMPPIITDASSLTNQAVLQCRAAATMSVAANGSGVSYQWFHDGTAIAGATTRTYSISNMTAADAGNYYVQVFNARGSTNSPTARLIYVPDTVPPAILYALASTNLTQITVVFSEAIDTNNAPDIPFNFFLMDTNTGLPIAITNAVAPNETSIIVQTDPYDLAHGHSLKVAEIRDKCANNLLPDRTLAVHNFRAVLVPLNGVWRYDDTSDTNPIDVDWAQPGYNASVPPWKSGAGPFDAKRAANGLAGLNCRDVALHNLGPVGTCIALSNSVNSTNITVANFRTTFFYGGNPADAVLVLSGKVDDGALVFLNGTELQRIRMPAGVITRATLANVTVNDGDAQDSFQYLAPATLVNGNNVLAIEAHQVNLTSSDLTMGLVLTAWTTEPPPEPSRPTILVAPKSQTVTAGESALFSVTAAGSEPLRYQWLYNGARVSRGTNATLILSNVQPFRAGSYAVIVTNLFGAVTSAVATLTVHYGLALNVTGSGTVTLNPALTNYAPGSLVTLSATPPPGWTFLHWLGDADGTSPTTSLVMTRNKCVEAVFGTALNITTAGDGSVTAQPSAALYPYGTMVRLTAVPAAGNHFALWGDAGSGTNNPLLYTVTSANPTVSAAFAPLSAAQYALTVVADGFGGVTANPRGNRFASGANVTLTVAPDAGQQFLGWSGDASGMQNPLVVVMNSSKVIIAQFTKRPLLVLQPCSEPSLEDGFQFLLTGEFGGRYAIEAATELAAGATVWTPVATVTNAFGAAQFNDAIVTNRTQRFYRAARVAP